MEWIIILIMILGALFIIGLIRSICKDEAVFAIICFIIAEICLIIISLIALKLYFNKEIPAIEVYRDNTMMIVTYQNSIPIDSVVVYKNE